jgi:hypothetical protein
MVRLNPGVIVQMTRVLGLPFGVVTSCRGLLHATRDWTHVVSMRPT